MLHLLFVDYVLCLWAAIWIENFSFMKPGLHHLYSKNAVILHLLLLACVKEGCSVGCFSSQPEPPLNMNFLR